MAITQTTIDALEASIAAAVANGTWRVQTIVHGDQSTTLISLDQALDFLGKMKAQASIGVARTRYATFDKGV